MKTDYPLQFLLFVVANSPFDLGTIIIVLSFLRGGHTYKSCATALAIPKRVVLHAFNTIVMTHWSTFQDAFAGRWECTDPDHPLYRHISAAVDNNHVPIAAPNDPLFKWLMWLGKPVYKGHALIFNVFMNWGKNNWV